MKEKKLMEEKFTCTSYCNLTFPISELSLCSKDVCQDESVCRMCSARQDAFDAQDYKEIETARELLSEIYFERKRLNIDFGIYDGDLQW